MSRSLHLNDRRFDVREFADEFALLTLGGTYQTDQPALAQPVAPTLPEGGFTLPALGRAILDANISGLRDIIATEEEICLVWASGKKERVYEQLAGRVFEIGTSVRTWTLPVWFADHDDWHEVCAATGMPRAQVITRLLAGTYSVAMFGFVPGFVYMHGLEPALHVPRKSTPATTIAPGTLAIGGKYLGLYSLATPAGWHAVGRVPMSVFDIGQMPPLCVSPGDNIVLSAIGQQEYEELGVRS